VTFGLFLLVLNGAMLKFAAVFVPGFRIQGWMPAIWTSLILSLLNLLIEIFLGPEWPSS
jgi:putative membrane protein